MSKFKKKVALYTTMLAFLSLSSASIVQALDITSVTNGGDVIGKSSNMELSQNAAKTKININNMGGAGAVGQVDYQNFSVGANQHVNFGFSDMSQTIINRVLGGQASQILGKMTNSCADGVCDSFAQTGKVVLINPAGVMFGAGSMVDLNSLTTSTFDIKNIKNLDNFKTQAALDNYTNGHLQGYSAYSTNGGQITFDKSYTSQFDQKGITNYNHTIDVNGAQFNHYSDINNGTVADVNTNKSLNFVSDKIQYKDSLIRTGNNGNYISGSGDVKSYSNVKLITADGVTFGYDINGNTKSINDDLKPGDTGYNSYSHIIDNGTNTERSIDINNSGIASGTPAIESGDVYVNNISKNANSSVKVSNSYIKADKLQAFENGDISIISANKATVTNSRLETANVNKNTESQDGGRIVVKGDNGTTVKDSLLFTAGLNKRVSANDNSGVVAIISSNGNVNIDNTKAVARGDVVVNGEGGVTANKSLLSAANDINTTDKYNVQVTSNSAINMTDSSVSAAGDTLFSADSIKISSNQVNGKNNSVISADQKLEFNSNNTTIDNASLVYRDIKFTNSNGKNNVTIANNTTFAPLDANGNIKSDVNIETNGNLTFDNAKVQTAKYTISGDTEDKGHFTVNGVSHNNANNITATSTQGDVTVKNGSNINANNNINMNSKTGNYTQDASTLNAGNNVSITASKAAKIQNQSTVKATNDATITAASITVSDSTVNAVRNNATLTANGSGDNGNITLTNSTVEAANDATVKSTKGTKVTVKKSNVIAGSDKANWDKTKDANDTIGNATVEATSGSVYITDNSKVLSQDKDVNIVSKNKIVFGNTSGVNIDKTSTIEAQNNAKIQSTADNIEAEKTTMPTIKYGNRLTLDAKKDNIITSADSLKSVNVDYKAGGANRIYTTGDAQFVNSSFEAPNNFVESGKDVILNNHVIKSATANAKDTTTQIFANGNVTTDNVTKENLNAAGPYTYPQSVSTERTGTAKTTMDINNTKLKITTDTVKDSKNPDNGSITLDLKNAGNKDAGVELTARNVAALDKDPTGGYNKTGYYKSGTAKWDNNIAPKEGPEVRLNATDDKVAIKTIYSDKLTLDPNDTKIADGKDATITVKDQGGFNLDPNLDYQKDGDKKVGDGYTYDKTVKSHEVSSEGGDLNFGDWSEWKLVGEKVDENGNKVRVYERTRDGEVTDRITTTIDEEHQITFDNNGNPSQFNLVYDKKDTTIDPGHKISAEDVKKDPTIVPPGHTPEEFIQTDDKPCPDLPEIEKERPSTADSLINTVRLPREQVEISKTSKISDNTADQTANIMSAAAKVDLSAEENSDSDDEDKAE